MNHNIEIVLLDTAGNMIYIIISCFHQVEAVSTSVQDSSVLVQRSTLDLILFCFPFHMSQVTNLITNFDFKPVLHLILPQ